MSFLMAKTDTIVQLPQWVGRNDDSPHQALRRKVAHGTKFCYLETNISLTQLRFYSAVSFVRCDTKTVMQETATTMEAGGSPKMAVCLPPATSHKRVKIIRFLFNFLVPVVTI